MNKHTSGPWRIGEAATNYYIQIVGTPDDDDSDHIADVMDNEREIPNAYLITAAPDLLTALKALLRDHHNWTVGRATARDMARAAIAKAEGRVSEIGGK